MCCDIQLFKLEIRDICCILFLFSRWASDRWSTFHTNSQIVTVNWPLKMQDFADILGKRPLCIKQSNLNFYISIKCRTTNKSSCHTLFLINESGRSCSTKMKVTDCWSLIRLPVFSLISLELNNWPVSFRGPAGTGVFPFLSVSFGLWMIPLHQCGLTSLPTQIN